MHFYKFLLCAFVSAFLITSAAHAAPGGVKGKPDKGNDTVECITNDALNASDRFDYTEIRLCKKNSPYTFYHGAVIFYETSIHIDAGVEINSDVEVFLNIYGDLYINGTKKKPVINSGKPLSFRLYAAADRITDINYYHVHMDRLEEFLDQYSFDEIPNDNWYRTGFLIGRAGPCGETSITNSKFYNTHMALQWGCDLTVQNNEFTKSTLILSQWATNPSTTYTVDNNTFSFGAFLVKRLDQGSIDGNHFEQTAYTTTNPEVCHSNSTGNFSNRPITEYACP